MRTLMWLFFCLVVFGPQPQARPVLQTTAQSNPQQRLELNTTVLKVEYCYSPSNLVLTLRLVFTNVGNAPIILQKKSSAITRYMISRNIRKAHARDYVLELTDTLDLGAAGFSVTVPDRSLFTILKPSESYSTENSVVIPVFDAKEYLRPGKYLLQVRVATWYYPPEWRDTFRKQWSEQGYLWTADVISQPMPFEVERGRPKGPSCK
jgi:hypothetical protein